MRIMMVNVIYPFDKRLGRNRKREQRLGFLYFITEEGEEAVTTAWRHGHDKADLQRKMKNEARKRNDDGDAKEELYSLVTVVEIPKEELNGLGTKVIDDEG